MAPLQSETQPRRPASDAAAHCRALLHSWASTLSRGGGTPSMPDDAASLANADDFMRAALDSAGQPRDAAALEAALRALVEAMLRDDDRPPTEPRQVTPTPPSAELTAARFPRKWSRAVSCVAKLRTAKAQAATVAASAHPASAQPNLQPCDDFGGDLESEDDDDDVLFSAMLPSAAAHVGEADEVLDTLGGPGLHAMEHGFIGSRDSQLPASPSPHEPCSPQAALVTRRAVVAGDIADASDSDSDAGAGFDGDDGTVGEVNQFVLLELLGRGAQGEVFLAMDTESGELRALKAVERPAEGVRMNAARRRKLEALTSEVAIMQRLRHRNVVRLHEVIDDPAQAKLFLVLQYVEHGPISSVSAEGVASKTVEAGLLAAYAQQLCAGLSYLHRNGVIHRDVKPENILVGANEQVFLADFGVSEAFDEAVANRVVSGTRGTPAFLAPELLQVGLELRRESVHGGALSTLEAQAEAAAAVSHVDGEAVDVWALGMTLYVLLYGKLPWEFTDAQDLFDAIQRRPIELRPQAAVMRSLRSSGASTYDVPTGGGVSIARFSRTTLSIDAWPPQAAWSCEDTSQIDATSPKSDAGMCQLPPILSDVVSPLFAPHRSHGHVPQLHPQGRGSSSPPLRAQQLPVFQVDVGIASDLPTPNGRQLASFADDPALLASTAYGGVCRSARRGGNEHGAKSGVMPSASADEGWRRILHGMLQRDPKRRTKLPELRRQFALLELRMEEAERLVSTKNAASRSLA